MSCPQRVYTWVPRLLAHVSRSPLIDRRTWVVQCPAAFEQFATTRQPLSVCWWFLNAQNVSPAHAPSALMMVGSMPCRNSRNEQLLPSGAQIPRIMLSALAVVPGAALWSGTDA